ncbi:transposase [Lewinella sp. JB7]|uniref:transposase n=1 Tax=Lewinella sp. JB7 TaxID=2962887 RepID=UPI0020C9E703|nr:transposase [Lewinella sp. JB7]MCP9234789.1 transposase [Lewinella sp. JB7]
MKSYINVSHFPLGVTPVHITYRLAGSIPMEEKRRIAQRRAEQVAALRHKLRGQPEWLSTEVYTQEMQRISGEVESEIERLLHRWDSGPMHLKCPTISSVIVVSWRFLHDYEEIKLYAVCVMSNHVHVILSAPTGSEKVCLSRIMNRHKRYTACACNLILDTTGQAFWAPNYFDRTIRNGKFFTAMWYVLNNPVKARMVDRWEDWHGTYVNPAYLSHFVENEERKLRA